MKKIMLVMLTVGLLAGGCGGSYPEETSPEEQIYSETVTDTIPEEDRDYIGEKVGQRIFDSIAYEFPNQKFLQPFINEFDDGTVIDKAMIKMIYEDSTSQPGYYLIGIGLNNGDFRSMALELTASSDNSLYLDKYANKHIVEGNKCDFCYFTSVANKINGVDCDKGDNPNGNCTYRVDTGNNMFKYKYTN